MSVKDTKNEIKTNEQKDNERNKAKIWETEREGGREITKQKGESDKIETKQNRERNLQKERHSKLDITTCPRKVCKQQRSK
jgi:hypothetical protein